MTFLVWTATRINVNVNQYVKEGGDNLKDSVLGQFRQLADALSMRTKRKMTINFERKKGGEETMEAEYDPLLSTVLLGNAVVPLSELKLWMKLLYDAIPGTVKVNQ